MHTLALHKEIYRFETFTLVVRGIAVAWDILALATFVELGISSNFRQARPLFIAGSVLALFFLVILCWPVRSDVRRRLPRVMLVLRWQVATGLTIAFTLGFVVRSELRMAFWIFGAYLVIPVVFLMLISLVELSLRKRYATLDDLARKEEHNELARLIAIAVADERSRRPRRRFRRFQQFSR